MLSPVAVSGLLATPFFAAALLLAVSGWAKLRHPGSAVGALKTAGLPSGDRVVRLLGAAECLIGLGCLIAPGPGLSVGLAGIYLGFALFVVKLLRSPDPLPSCGCVGGRDTPATRLHVLVDLGAVAAGVAVAARPLPGLVPFAADLGLAGLPFVVGVALTAYLIHLTLTYLPAAMLSFTKRPPERGERASPPPPFAMHRAIVSEDR